MTEDEIDAWVGELLADLSVRCYCGCARNPLLRLRWRDKLRLWVFAVQMAVVAADWPIPAAELLDDLVVLDDPPDEIPPMDPPQGVP